MNMKLGLIITGVVVVIVAGLAYFFYMRKPKAVVAPAEAPVVAPVEAPKAATPEVVAPKSATPEVAK